MSGDGESKDMEMRGKRRRGSRLARFARTLVTVAIVSVVTLGGMEILVRIFDPLGIGYFLETTKYFQNMTPNDAFGYIHTPHYRAELQGAEVKINSHGLRGPGFEAAKPPGKKRLLILGDSVVFGWGVAQQDIFPVRLQNMLDEADADIEVIAAGVGSWNTRSEYEFLMARGIHYGPDVVLLVVVDNDVEAKPGGGAGKETERVSANWVRGLIGTVWRSSASRFYLAGYVQYFRKIRSKKVEYSTIDEGSPEWSDAKSALNGIVDACRDGDIGLIVYLYSSGKALEDNRMLLLYEKVLESRDVPMFLLPDVLFADPDYRNSVVDSHANSRGQELISQEMYRVIMDMFERRGSSN